MVRVGIAKYCDNRIYSYLGGDLRGCWSRRCHRRFCRLLFLGLWELILYMLVADGTSWWTMAKLDIPLRRLLESSDCSWGILRCPPCLEGRPGQFQSGRHRGRGSGRFLSPDRRSYPLSQSHHKCFLPCCRPQLRRL